MVQNILHFEKTINLPQHGFLHILFLYVLLLYVIYQTKYTPKLINWLQTASVNTLICSLFIGIQIILHIKHYLLPFNVIFRTDLEQKFIKKTLLLSWKFKFPLFTSHFFTSLFCNTHFKIYHRNYFLYVQLLKARTIWKSHAWWNKKKLKNTLF